VFISLSVPFVKYIIAFSPNSCMIGSTSGGEGMAEADRVLEPYPDTDELGPQPLSVCETMPGARDYGMRVYGVDVYEIMDDGTEVMLDDRTAA
jgi:hypothetical protein